MTSIRFIPGEPGVEYLGVDAQVGDEELSDSSRPFMRAPGNYDAKMVSDDTGLLCRDPSRTVQSDLEDSDINVIVRRFGITGEMPTGLVAPFLGDYEDVFDFQTAQNAVAAAQESFDAMPAAIRARFVNSPQAFLEFAVDPSNVDEMVRMGLAVPKPLTASQEVRDRVIVDKPASPAVPPGHSSQ